MNIMLYGIYLDTLKYKITAKQRLQALISYRHLMNKYNIEVDIEFLERYMIR
jgi:hypothetical protein